MDPRNEYQPGLPSVMPDHMDDIYTSRRPHDLNTTEVKPVQHYSIQTGEEFALEFMRDRANLGKPVFPNVGDPNYATGYMELKGILGLSHAGSETGSDISMLSMMEKYPKEFDRSQYGSIQSIPRSSLNQDNRQFVHGYSSSESYDNSSIMMKFLCSFGGRILPRPRDGKLRYVGGQTRILRIRKDISYHELIQKALVIYNQVHTIKYQLPGEDLDALVSVSSDEDIQNMMEEYNHQEDREGSQKLRMFLFSISDLEDAQFGLGCTSDDSEIQYVIAVNGMDLESRKNSTMVGFSYSANDINELDRQNIDGEANGNAPLTHNFDPTLGTHFSQPVLPTSSNSYEMYPMFYGDQMMRHGEPNGHDQYLMHHGVVNPSYKPLFEETPINMLPHMPNIQRGVINEGYLPSGLQVQNAEIPETLVRMMADTSIQQETLSPSPSQLFDGYSKNDNPEAAAAVTAAEGYPLPPTRTNQFQDYDEASSTSSSAFGAGPYVDSRSNAVDLSSLHPPPLPKRVYYSERIPREQVESLNRSSKSDDAHNSQFHVTDLLSGVNSQNSAVDSGTNLHDGNMSNLAEESSITAKPLHADGEGNKDILNKDNAVMLETENYRDDNHEKSPLEGKSDIPLKESNSDSNNDFKVQALPVPLTAKVDSDAPGDILIDINDRFPRELLNDMFSKAILEEDSSSQHPLASDGVGLSINMENHEPKSWSYFQKLAQDGIGNASLIDQDHLGFSPAIVGDNRAQHVTPLTTDEVPLNRAEFHLNFGEEMQKDLHGENATETTVLQSNYDQSQINDTESMQFDAMLDNLRAQDSEYEDGKFEKKNNSLPPLDPSLEEFDMSTLQVIMNEDLEELKELGSGTFGTVYHGKWRGTDVAIKRIKKTCFTGRSSEQERLTVEFWREADILSKLHHPNVVAFYGVVQNGPGGTMATITEYMVDGSLRHVLLRNDRYLDRRKRLIIAMDAAFGMEYLHSKNIVHFDLKCDNLLVNLKDPLRPICKVGDFGLSKIKRNTLVSGGVRGTLPWMAPELLNGSSSKVSEKVDVFSFGIVLWEILTGEEPYANMHYGAIIGGIVNNTLRPTIPNYCDIEWRTLMEQCWAPNPAVRPSFSEIASRLRIMSTAASQTKSPGHKASK
ncbi:probable serine/threonine-protein kinase DDB_G0267686 [Trifolium pratense]|uniref:probable serine/threonine-protein kinase DDB_G0267686 n=1 Tax=Trifolium pratense TaxID=57577 RepID=UPI001E6938CA|nr:probable serine/threonine-protein kinase DDB_G0267686 [Trifolium pratense]XP_045799705.1 probable serine/threonine-protein kinase DDB_G0267686 [Trifolium pratense]XP_045799706.1 probable serine/threonine-protein kinase DDB_G0267686 [Trifolium pratense]